ncbi:hypothetical protein Alg130_07531 [Pyrenophora tritici-repentis]|uniref:Uncharacterized protein n=2 Tax=Pyrenophora tritici-repentis TaxID=45151 RepID=A0A5M9L9W8_9PLEO|nr:hypothetical protein PtrV1_07106 [Pyrenophora tritici-repentis]KAF7448166.1 hypothetical protein A1F99_075300 [Pyrenophora tritici-repentis]KAF7571877.1 hypothetical protein PtrM4_093770 [Pyrenophora tritici-repentis]KAI0579405.1 hypothetical protein Alg130_07531 [Pyrenophora tritici-repentis]KAI0584554.1 hypothetical protein Alg215_03033 [Pyrenophora tritici-repentis]
MIYEYALKAENPIEAPKKVLGFTLSYCYPDRQYPEPSKKRQYQKGRFSLLYVCKAMKKEAAWVLYKKVPLKLEMTAMLAQYADIGIAWDTQTNFSKISMWLNAAQYRNIQLVVPSTDEATSLAEITELLLSTITQLLECWDIFTKTTDAIENCKVSVQIGTLFAMKTHPSRITARPTERIRKALKKLGKCIGKNKDVAKWTVTAMEDIKPKKEQGRCMLRKLKRRLRDDGFSFVSLSREAVPAKTEYCHYKYVKAVQRSTHIRFDG